MRELRRCPECHRRMKVDYRFHPLRYAVIHATNFAFDDRCWGGTDYIYKSEQEAVDAWNKTCEKRTG
jgi:hypothetical protein